MASKKQLDGEFGDEDQYPAVPEKSEKGLVQLGNTVTTIGDLRQLTFADIVQEYGGSTVLATEVIESDQFGTLLTKTTKNILVGVPFIMVKWGFYPGDYGEDFVSCWIITQKDERYILNDGSTGICAQLTKLTADTGRTNMLACPKGLRVSQYAKELPNGATTQAETYYIDTSL